MEESVGTLALHRSVHSDPSGGIGNTGNRGGHGLEGKDVEREASNERRQLERRQWKDVARDVASKTCERRNHLSGWGVIVEAIQHLEYEHGPALQSAHFRTFFVRRHIDPAKL